MSVLLACMCISILRVYMSVSHMHVWPIWKSDGIVAPKAEATDVVSCYEVVFTTELTHLI